MSATPLFARARQLADFARLSQPPGRVPQLCG